MLKKLCTISAPLYLIWIPGLSEKKFNYEKYDEHHSKIMIPNESYALIL